MRIVMLYHSLVSDWNHGNAHFLRGVVAELLDRGHEVKVYEPQGGWSRTHLREERPDAEQRFCRAFPRLRSTTYRRGSDPAGLIDGADLVLVHEWNDPDLVRDVGKRRRRGMRVLFHDTHHRGVTAPKEMGRYDLSRYDGVLAFGDVLRRIYVRRKWAERAWTWHEAADTRVFRPRRSTRRDGDLVWIGNWGDEERTAELRRFLLDPVRRLGLRANVHGVRYPPHALRALRRAGIAYRGWIANHEVPLAFARHRVTVHVPRRPYSERLRGIPTIRPFEALACGIPLVSAPWDDSEGLFTAGRDYLVARDGGEMRRHLTTLLEDDDAARDLARHGRRTILERHTCAHRVDELMGIVEELS